MSFSEVTAISRNESQSKILDFQQTIRENLLETFDVSKLHSAFDIMMGIIGEQQREISRVSKLLVLIDERTAGYSNESGTSNGNKKRQAVKNTGMNQAVGSRRGSRRPSLEADIIENTEEGEDDTSVDRSGDDGMKSLSQKRKESKNKNNKDSNSDRNEDDDLTSALQEGQNERQNGGMQEFDRDVVDF